MPLLEIDFPRRILMGSLLLNSIAKHLKQFALSAVSGTRPLLGLPMVPLPRPDAINIKVYGHTLTMLHIRCLAQIFRNDNNGLPTSRHGILCNPFSFEAASGE